MLKVQNNFQEIIKKLIHGDIVRLTFNQSEINMRCFEDASKLSLSTAVYSGGNYIPSSVRKGLSEKIMVSYPSIRTYLTIDEQAYQVNLNYLGETGFLDHHHLIELLEEFGYIADKWKAYLDERDRNDLVYVHAK